MPQDESDPLLQRLANVGQQGAQRSFGWRTYTLEVVILLNSLAIGIVAGMQEQYVYSRVAQDIANETGHVINTTHGSSCYLNKTDYNHKQQVEAQQRTAQWNIYFALLCSIPSTAMTLVYVPASDTWGRRALLIVTNSGTLLFGIIQTATCLFNLSLYVLFAAWLAMGLLGGPISRLAAYFAYISDVTEGESRSWRITFIEGSTIIFFALSGYLTGILIQDVGYTLTSIIGTVLVLLDLAIVIFILPESLVTVTRQWPRPISEVRRCFAFYFNDSPSHPRCFFIMALAIFTLLAFPMLTSGVETLFALNSPLCWNSVKLGNFFAAKRFTQGLLAIIGLKILQRCLGDYAIGFFALVLYLASHVVEAFATTDAIMYAAMVGCVSPLLSGIIRAMMSKFTPQGQHGALFGSVSFVEGVAALAGGTMFNAIYRQTVAEFPGTAFLVMAGFVAVAFIIYIPLKMVMNNSPRPYTD